MIICIAGIDGSGKSTVAKQVCERYGKKVKYVWARWEPFFLRPFIMLLNMKSQRMKRHFSLEDDEFKARTKSKNNLLKNNLFCECWLFFAEIDYFLQLIWKVTLPHFINKIIICDRYIYDFYIDQLININKSPNQLKKFLWQRMLSVFPKPKMLVYIDISPETGCKRKVDGTSVSYLKVRKQYYDELSLIYPSKILNGEQELESLVFQVMEVLGVTIDGAKQS